MLAPEPPPLDPATPTEPAVPLLAPAVPLDVVLEPQATNPTSSTGTQAKLENLCPKPEPLHRRARAAAEIGMSLR
jgi:hypothetical protein